MLIHPSRSLLLQTPYYVWSWCAVPAAFLTFQATNLDYFVGTAIAPDTTMLEAANTSWRNIEHRT